jgi:hypothetical protein
MMINISKKCSKCGDNKEITEFSKDKSRKDGYANYCKLCKGSLDKKIYDGIDKQVIKSKNKNLYIKNKDIKKKQNIIYYHNNKEKYLIKLREYNKIYSLNNKEKRNIYQRVRRTKIKYQTRWRNLLLDTLKRLGKTKESSTQELLNYSALDLKNHLDNLGMDWNNDHIDHKIPVTWFKPETPPYIVNDLRNLQPLNENDNKSKGNLYMHPVSIDFLELVKPHILEKYQNSLGL